eukprot:comp14970_c0_seq1/m.22151 comp14970_c0_seq1/g.22151  ORF comp14970_c0_seq1/g.22151 comp14970_c0_seq1/m.22151 type:complete len:286 (-) comp14970_c0_seq1:43-900(-)
MSGHGRSCVCEICTCGSHHCPRDFTTTYAASHALPNIATSTRAPVRPRQSVLWDNSAPADFSTEAHSAFVAKQADAHRASIFPVDRKFTMRAKSAPFEGQSETKQAYKGHELPARNAAALRNRDSIQFGTERTFAGESEAKAKFRGVGGVRNDLFDAFGTRAGAGHDDMKSQMKRTNNAPFNGISEAREKFTRPELGGKATKARPSDNPLFDKGKFSDETENRAHFKGAFVPRNTLDMTSDKFAMHHHHNKDCPAVELGDVRNRKKSADGHFKFKRSMSGAHWVQ